MVYAIVVENALSDISKDFALAIILRRRILPWDGEIVECHAITALPAKAMLIFF
jgi:hypothetical protein